MAELRQRPKAATTATPAEAEDTSSTGTSTPIPSSANSSSNDLKGLAESRTKNGKRTTTLKERSKIPYSLYVTLLSITLLQGFSGVWTYASVESWMSSVTTSLRTLAGSFVFAQEIVQSLIDGNYRTPTEYFQFGLLTICMVAPLYVFVVAPFRAGVWTGTRATRHRIHRFMGLAFMAQYALAWVEFLTNYDAATTSHLRITIALNGIIQGYSAFFSFKVLPELDDAGYFSDKAVMSRSFVHENIYFSLLVVFGSVYYHQGHRELLRSTLPGRIAEYAFVFFPYIVIRPFFPLTRFKDAGTTYKGRSEQNAKFYEIGTTMVKIFFLWAKYFLGFFVNFMVFMELATPTTWKLIHGMFLLNLGTVSLAMFLHTLRFKKILPPKFTFTLYLMQIYATFAGLPMAIDMFRTHPNLCALCLSGLLANMTRNRTIHGVWCVVALALITQSNIAW